MYTTEQNVNVYIGIICSKTRNAVGSFLASLSWNMCPPSRATIRHFLQARFGERL
jgi:hypothetical protein